MRDKLNREAGCGTKTLPWEWDLLLLEGRMQDGFRSDGEIQENRMSYITDQVENCNSNQVGLR